MADIIISEAEMTMAINQLSYYAEFLAACAVEYRGILTKLTEMGVKDVQIKAALFDLQHQVNVFDQKFPGLCDEAQTAFRAFLTELDVVDNFSYPYSRLDQISILLSSFLG